MQDRQRDLFAALTDFPYRPDTRRTPAFAAAALDQFARLCNQPVGQAIKRRAQSDASRIAVVEEEIRLPRDEASRDVLCQCNAQIARIAHQQQRSDRSKSVSQTCEAVLALGRR